MSKVRETRILCAATAPKVTVAERLLRMRRAEAWRMQHARILSSTMVDINCTNSPTEKANFVVRDTVSDTSRHLKENTIWRMLALPPSEIRY